MVLIPKSCHLVVKNSVELVDLSYYGRAGWRTLELWNVFATLRRGRVVCLCVISYRWLFADLCSGGEHESRRRSPWEITAVWTATTLIDYSKASLPLTTWPQKRANMVPYFRCSCRHSVFPRSAQLCMNFNRGEGKSGSIHRRRRISRKLAKLFQFEDSLEGFQGLQSATNNKRTGKTKSGRCQLEPSVGASLK